MRRLIVSDVMTIAVSTAREATPFKELARIMTERRVSALPVLDPADRLVGIVSEADLLPKEEHRDDPTGRHVLSFAGGRASRVKAAGDTAGQVMTANVVVTHPDATLVEAAKEMARHHVKRLPVVDTDNRLVGIISRADLLTVFLRDDEDIRREVISEILIRVLWADPERFEVQVRDGIVTLSGELEQRSHIPIAVQLTHRVDGVIDVVDQLSYALDDTTRAPHRF
ncbi:MAG TPA: CBS domain-containing protein [Pseudonocardiaceae bacterium]|nr:CBS domain-containing protein [Pseudonocardiaceae bacterium]